MIWLLTLLTFVATTGVVVALVYAFSPGEVSIATRLARIAGLAGPVPEETKFADRQKSGFATRLPTSANCCPLLRRKRLRGHNC